MQVNNTLKQIRDIEESLNALKKIKLINTDKTSTETRSKEHSLYSEKYRALKATIFANDGYKANEAEKTEYTDKIFDLEVFFDELSKSDSYLNGLKKLLRHDIT